jgi:hypothetical protein
MRTLFRGPDPAKRRVLHIAVWLFVGLAVCAGAQTFDPGCPLPFGAIKKHHPIDDTCPRRGDVPDPPSDAQAAAHALQNEAKNNFCQTGTPALVTFNSFKQLQKKLDQKVTAAKTWTRETLPPDRSVLKDIHKTSDGVLLGEGNVVKLSAWLMKRRQGSEESCNCQGSTKESTDIHVVLIDNSNRDDTPECKSVTAEISPHFEPENWDSHALLLAEAHPFRFTGQLMYDAAHRPCSGNPLKPAASAPKRISSWEIHPVYAIDVCKRKSLQNCKANDSSAWIPLDEWKDPEEPPDE